MRIAWFTPWPPQPSGIAGRSAELVPRLAARGHGVDVFVDERAVAVGRGAEDGPPAPGGVRLLGAHDFVWRAGKGGYDLPVYQVGNSALHEFLWPYLFRWPGLTLLHDARLHHARGRALLSRGRAEAYRAEFAWSHPGVPAELAELGVAGLSGAYLYTWPMTRAALERSRVVGVHARGAIAELRATGTSTPIEYVPLGEGRAAPMGDDDRRARRAALGFDRDTVVFGVFGALTAEKRLETILRAYALTRTRAPAIALLLAGRPDASLDVTALARDLGVDATTRVVDGLDDDAFDDALAAVDVCLALRWPTVLEMSGPWVRALAAGRPTVIVDHAHLADVPTLDPRTWALHAPAAAGLASGDAIAVAVDILDEAHSLRLAMTRLATDAELRARLGTRARRYWEAEHTVERMVDAVDALLARARDVAPPATVVPEHLVPDPFAAARAIVAPFGDACRGRLDTLAPRRAGA